MFLTSKQRNLQSGIKKKSDSRTTFVVREDSAWQGLVQLQIGEAGVGMGGGLAPLIEVQKVAIPAIWGDTRPVQYKYLLSARLSEKSVC